MPNTLDAVETRVLHAKMCAADLRTPFDYARYVRLTFANQRLVKNNQLNKCDVKESLIIGILVETWINL